jgi:acylphosphatase
MKPEDDNRIHSLKQHTTTHMAGTKRLTAHVTGRIQKVGYKAKVVESAKDLRLKGMVQDLNDGRVKIIAEGESLNLERFIRAVNIKNSASIHVSSISKEYSEAVGDLEDFKEILETKKAFNKARGGHRRDQRAYRTPRNTYPEPVKVYDNIIVAHIKPKETSQHPDLDLRKELIRVNPNQSEDPEIKEVINQGLQILAELDHQHTLLHRAVQDTLHPDPQAWKAVKAAMTKYAASYAKLTKISKKLKKTLTQKYPETIQPRGSPDFAHAEEVSWKVERVDWPEKQVVDPCFSGQEDGLLYR